MKIIWYLIHIKNEEGVLVIRNPFDKDDYWCNSISHNLYTSECEEFSTSSSLVFERGENDEHE